MARGLGKVTANKTITAVAADTNGLKFIYGTTWETNNINISMPAGTFTNTYRTHLVVGWCDALDNGVPPAQLRIMKNGVQSGSSTYYGGYIYGSHSSIMGVVDNAAASKWEFSFGGPGCNFTLWVQNAMDTTYKGRPSVQGTFQSGYGFGTFGGVVLDYAHDFDGLHFMFGSTTTGGYKVYGLANS